MSNISSIIGLLGLYFCRPYIFIIFMWLGYFFDCMDGHYARTYDMCTTFGDYYDHTSDILIHFTFGLLFFSTFAIHNYVLYFVLSLCLSLTGLHMGCQEIIHTAFITKSPSFKSHSSHSLQWLKVFADEKYIHWSRYFGTGTSFLLLYGTAFMFMIYS